MNRKPSDSRGDEVSRQAGAESQIRAQSSDDAAVRDRLRAALERELAVATAAGDHAARERILAALKKENTT